MDEEEAIMRITKLLEQGCTMLASHHDCGAPLFRCKGEVVCPVCTFEKAEGPSSGAAPHSGLVMSPDAVREADRLEVSKRGKGLRTGEETKLAKGAGRGAGAENFGGQEASSPKVTAEVREEVPPRDDLRAAEVQLRDSLLRRLRALTEEMERERDLDRMRKQLECIDGLVRVLRSMGG